MALELDAHEMSARLVPALAALAQAMGQAMGKDLTEADLSRILDAILLVAIHPADP